MSFNVAMLEAMKAEGLDLDACIRVLAAGERKVDRTNAERQARHRAKKSNAVTVTPVTADEPPLDDIYSNPPVTPPVEAKASTAPKGRSDRGSKIPEDWEAPSVAQLSTEAQALAERWPAAAYRAEAEAFRNYWLAESSAKARKSNWNRAWANRIVAVNGRVMREAKFAGSAPVGTAAKRPMNADELRNAIRFAEDHGDHERASECKAQLQRLRSEARPPPPQIQNILSKTAAGLRASNG